MLREQSFNGVEHVQAELERRCGAAHSLKAISMRASRIHCSLQKRTVYPSCGAVDVTINRQTGMRRLCTERFHLEEERAFNEMLERERAAAEDPEAIAAVRRECERLRQRNSRLARELGVPSRRRGEV